MSPLGDSWFRLGEAEIDPLRGTVRRAGREDHLEPRTLSLLLYLAERPGTVVSKEEIVTTVWEAQSLSDDVVWRAISKLRQAFGDDPEQPRWVETIPRRGYRLLVVPEVAGNDVAVGGAPSPNPPAAAAEPSTGAAVAAAKQASESGTALATTPLVAPPATSSTAAIADGDVDRRQAPQDAGGERPNAPPRAGRWILAATALAVALTALALWPRPAGQPSPPADAAPTRPSQVRELVERADGFAAQLTAEGFEKARVLLAQAADLAPDDGAIRADLTVVLLQAGRREEAHEQLRLAQHLAPGTATVRRATAQWHLDAGAIAAANAAISGLDDPADIHLRCLLAYVDGRLAEAVRCSREHAEAVRGGSLSPPARSRALGLLANAAYFQLGDRTGGLTCARRALEQDPLDALSLAVIAWSEGETHPERGHETLRTAIVADPTSPYLHWIALGYEHMIGSARHARELAEQLLEILDALDRPSLYRETHRALARLRLADLIAGDEPARAATLREAAYAWAAPRIDAGSEMWTDQLVIAAAAAATGRLDEGMTAAERMVANGGLYPHHLARDPLLAPLRGDPRFAALAAQVDERLAAERVALGVRESLLVDGLLDGVCR